MNHPSTMPNGHAIVRVTAAVIVKDGTILIAQRGRSDRMAGLWEFPGGKVEAGETPQQCLRRELCEELAMNADIGRHLGTSRYHYDHMSIELIAYRAYWDGQPFRLITHQDFCWVTPKQLADYAFTPADLPFVQLLASGSISLF
ncbi:DNA mismatch repair protein MutT [Desulfosarcina widdelii]|uniref:8-oxo-dGTP diphosphatase n=1 Tax=Desulfosarcina widdelii TaxID=947919 RepID=A0A5K7YYK3_9BACT|nr:(deoxy)nucleoside triphosphate pyrophosphohydrolase [Desulfosarcina widdelii]BBO73505.1 DNA mismatch repair protein MutT [Desulfosarcina widdelii]